MAGMQGDMERQASGESDDRYAPPNEGGKSVDGDVQPMAWTRKFAGGLRADIRRRAPFYVSDWTDGLGAKWNQKCLASTTFLMFACLAPAISFGALFDKDTNGSLGAFEMILSSAMSGVVYAFFSGQPLCIMGATGPELAYTVVFYQLCESLDLEFMTARVWEGLWCALFTVLTAVTDGSAICCYVTQFTEDVFSGLISLIFIIEAFINIGKEFDTRTLTGAYFAVLLAFGSFFAAMYFRAFRGTGWLTKSLRNTIANFGVTISILTFTAISLAWEDVDIKRLSIPDKFEPTMKLSDGTARPWLVNPFGMERDFPIWGIFFAAIPAVGLWILGFLDQNLTTLLINRKANGLKKPPAYHLDLMVCGVFIYPICAIFGLPFTHAATIRSLTHLISLTEYEEVKAGEGTIKKPVAVAEQRVTQLAIHVLIFLCAFLPSVLKKLPQAVLYGVFLFMGVTSIPGNALFDRMSLWLIWDTKKYPAFPCIQGISVKTVHLYTFIQFMCLVILYALKSIKAIAVVFPFFLVVIAGVRVLLPKIFNKEDLVKLDGYSALLREEDATGPKAEEAKERKATPTMTSSTKESTTDSEHVDVAIIGS
jgi:hypothetical protein